MFAILKRELSSYFSSPVGYVVTAVFMSFSGFFFYVQCLNAGTSSMYSVFQSMFFIVLFVIPLITMRLFCEDRKYKDSFIHFDWFINILLAKLQKV